MLSNEGAANIQRTEDDVLSALNINPELKAILYECLHSEDKIVQREQENYESEINEFILHEKIEK